MHETGIKLLNLMFRENEAVCVSPNKYGYHSMPLSSAVAGMPSLVSPNSEIEIQKVNSDDLLLVALNPIQGFRQDGNCTAFRNFLLELDYGELSAQIEYVKRLGIPYSASIFSGNKSIHFLISLSEDLPNENIYRKFSKWILNIATAADQNTSNPSRSIRIPGVVRPETGKKQELIGFNGSVNIAGLVLWLNQYPDCQPKEREKKTISDKPDLDKVPRWVQSLLQNGLDPTKGRNLQWFSISCEYTLSGFSESDIVDILSMYFVPERDFTEREWLTTIQSAVKYIHEKRN